MAPSELVMLSEIGDVCGLMAAVKLDMASDDENSEALLSSDETLEDNAREELWACEGTMDEVSIKLENCVTVVAIASVELEADELLKREESLIDKEAVALTPS